MEMNDSYMSFLKKLVSTRIDTFCECMIDFFLQEEEYEMVFRVDDYRRYATTIVYNLQEEQLATTMFSEDAILAWIVRVWNTWVGQKSDPDKPDLD